MDRSNCICWLGYHGSVVYESNIVVMGGFNGSSYLNDVLSSGDGGATWTEVTASAGWSARLSFGCVVYEDKIYVVSGLEVGARIGDIWSSSDGGATWMEVTAAAGFTARLAFGCVVSDNRMYIMGGDTGSQVNNVVSSSDGGTTWTEVTAAAGWSTRKYFSAVVQTIYDHDKIFVIGGTHIVGKARDTWSSSDGGMTWVEVAPSAAWDARSAHTSVVSGYKIYILGGWDTVALNDVWVLDTTPLVSPAVKSAVFTTWMGAHVVVLGGALVRLIM